MNVVIRPGFDADRDSFRFVMDWHGGVSTPKARMVEFCEQAAGSFVAESDGVIVGQVLYLDRYSENGRHVSAILMYVVPERRGAGIGSRLLDAVEEFGRSVGAYCCTLTVDALNTRARALYERRGYVPYGEQESIYDVDRPDGSAGSVTATETCMYVYLTLPSTLDVPVTPEAP